MTNKKNIKPEQQKKHFKKRKSMQEKVLARDAWLLQQEFKQIITDRYLITRNI